MTHSYRPTFEQYTEYWARIWHKHYNFLIFQSTSISITINVTLNKTDGNLLTHSVYRNKIFINWTDLAYYI
jgi:hypothetical protein